VQVFKSRGVIETEKRSFKWGEVLGKPKTLHEANRLLLQIKTNSFPVLHSPPQVLMEDPRSCLHRSLNRAFSTAGPARDPAARKRKELSPSKRKDSKRARDLLYHRWSTSCHHRGMGTLNLLIRLSETWVRPTMQFEGSETRMLRPFLVFGGSLTLTSTSQNLILLPLFRPTMVGSS